MSNKVSSLPSPGLSSSSTGSHSEISIIKYQAWFDALVTNDVTTASSILSSTKANPSIDIINGTFAFLPEDDPTIHPLIIQRAAEKQFKLFSKPLHLAVGFCGKEIVQFLLNNGADPMVVDYGGNILHSIVSVAFHNSALEEQLCQMIQWLAEVIGKQKMLVLYEQEHDGLRPVEYAAQQGYFAIMQELMMLKDCKVFNGIKVYNNFDITEYECGDRQMKSPLQYIAHMDKERLQSKLTKDVLLGPMVNSWIKAKVKTSLIPVLVWLFIRLAFIILYFISDANVNFLGFIYGANFSTFVCSALGHINIETKPFLGYLIVLVSFGFLILISDVVDLIRAFKNNSFHYVTNLSGRKSTISQGMFYRIANTILIVMLLILLIIYANALNTNTIPQGTFYLLVSLFRSIIPLFCLLSVMYFLQLMPIIGPSVIQLRNMLIDMLRFSVILLIVVLPFVHSFETFVHTNAKHGCIDEFSSPLQTFYTLFLVMNHMYDTTAIEVNYKEVFYALHFIYIQVVSIMLINFLIAIMSDSTINDRDEKDIIVTVSRLEILMTLENRTFWLMKWFYRRTKKMGFYCVKDKVYLLTVTEQ